jgi:hypothetical protein
MTRSIVGSIACVLFLALLPSANLAVAQEQADQDAFYDVQGFENEIYSYKDLKFSGDYTSFDSPSGMLALGKTEAGATIVIVLSSGNFEITGPESGQEKIKTVFGAYPYKGTFKSIYMRLNPKEYEQTIGKAALTKISSDEALTKAKDIFGLKFNGSFHAGPKAMLPPLRTRVMEFETEVFGWIFNEESYWLKLRKYGPYVSIYPSNTKNPRSR